jgi:hypothetical protein
MRVIGSYSSSAKLKEFITMDCMSMACIGCGMAINILGEIGCKSSFGIASIDEN